MPKWGAGIAVNAKPATSQLQPISFEFPVLSILLTIAENKKEKTQFIFCLFWFLEATPIPWLVGSWLHSKGHTGSPVLLPSVTLLVLLTPTAQDPCGSVAHPTPIIQNTVFFVVSWLAMILFLP